MKMFIKIVGRRWGFRFAKLRKCKGYCDSPKKKNKEIVVRSNLPQKEELDVTIHELLHAADWWKDEEWVEQVGTDIANILWRLGWRKTEQ